MMPENLKFCRMNIKQKDERFLIYERSLITRPKNYVLKNCFLKFQHASNPYKKASYFS
ncbi:hypothetical protein F981_02651 [Acinetobacter guillouiae CIP 63.46]|nr:hypothetical protein F981_02651 [Acinetobacter guillouiae CIP 63.46]